MADQAVMAGTLADFRSRCAQGADALAVALAVSLPWSTSATGILAVLWLLAVLPTLDLAGARRMLVQPAAMLPVALWLLAAVGMAWADAPVGERFDALRSFHKLLFIPILLLQFERSDWGNRVLGAFLASCLALMVVSWAFWLLPWLGPADKMPGVPVKDYIVQSGEFVLCAFALTHRAVALWRAGRRRAALTLGVVTATLLANVFFVATARTSVVVYAVLVVVLAFQRFGRRGGVSIALAGLVLVVLAFAASSYLQQRVFAVFDEIHRYQAEQIGTSTGFRLEFWKKSMDFVVAAPLLGHGTGSTQELFRRAAVGKSGVSASVTDNPHNVTLAVAIQLGMVGVAILYAMWIAHLVLFSGAGLASWIGFGLVVQNIVGSLSLAYLLDFSTGWLYVVGVGVLGGMALGKRGASSRPGDVRAAASPTLSTSNSCDTGPAGAPSDRVVASQSP